MLFHRVAQKSYDDFKNKLSCCWNRCSYIKNILRTYRNNYYIKDDSIIFEYISFIGKIEAELEQIEISILYYKPGDFVFKTRNYFEKLELLDENIESSKFLIYRINITHFMKFLQTFNIDTTSKITKSCNNEPSQIEPSFSYGKFNPPDILILSDEELIRHIDKNYFETIKDTILPPSYHQINPPAYETL